jgi:hypothetical protein
MTRNSVNRTLARLYWLLFVILLLLLAAKFADDIPGTPAVVISIAGQLYEFMRDMSLLIATGGVAYLSNIFQKRSKFVESLEEEWRNIVRTKSALLTYCERPYLGTDDYLAAFSRIRLIGLYPYAPLHDMRRALQTLDPRTNPEPTQDQKKLVKDAVLQAFYGLREVFLEELDLEEPQHTLLISGARRLKVAGASVSALVQQDNQRRRLDRDAAPRPDIDAMLVELRSKEKDNGGEPKR